jgi:hypothetical protein
MKMVEFDNDVKVKRAAAVAHDAVDALMEQIEVRLGAIREVVPDPDVDELQELMVDALRTVMPTLAIDRVSLRVAARAAVRTVKGFVAKLPPAPDSAWVPVPEVGPDGSILTPPGGQLVPVRPGPASTATSGSQPAQPSEHTRVCRASAAAETPGTRRRPG